MLAYSRHTKFRPFLKKLSKNKKRYSAVRRQAKQARRKIKNDESYVQMANQNIESAKSLDELWAIRHDNVLRYGDKVSARWAARDIFLFKRGSLSLDVGESFS